jgi:hypothetical protein
MSVLLLFIVAIGFSGLASAVDNNTLNGMDVNKSVGTTGVQNYTNTNGSHVNGLCVDEHTYIYYGDSVPVTKGTANVPQSNNVKKLIVNNYRDNMTPTDGANLQEAIWFFTDNKIPTDPAVIALINQTQADTKNISDTNYEQVLSNKTTLVNHTETTSTVKIGTTTNSSSVVTKLGENTTVQTIIGDKCTKIITTIMSFFQNQTTTDTVDTFLKTTTITDYYQTTVDSLIFNFDSYVGDVKQKLIFFTATPNTETTYNNNSTIIPEEFNQTNTNIVNTTFNTTNVTEICIPVPPVIVNNTTVVNTTVKTPETKTNETITPDNEIPLQHTGAPLIPLAVGILMILSGLGIRKFN